MLFTDHDITVEQFTHVHTHTHTHTHIRTHTYIHTHSLTHKDKQFEINTHAEAGMVDCKARG
jgi:hypothetical protein